MNLITTPGGFTVNTEDNVIQFQRVHPLHREFAPGVIDGPHSRATWRDWVAVVAIYAAAACALTGLLMGAGYLVGKLL